MDNKGYILATIDDGGVRQYVGMAPSKADLVALADKYITLLIKSGFEIFNIIEDIDQEANNHIFKAYHLKPSKRTRSSAVDYRIVVLELHELPVYSQEQPYQVDLDDLFKV